MCRNIKTLFNFEPPATELEIRAAALQFVRKLSGFTVPSKANEAAFDRAVKETQLKEQSVIELWESLADRQGLINATPNVKPAKGWKSDAVHSQT